jgi:hypothetical protein
MDATEDRCRQGYDARYGRGCQERLAGYEYVRFRRRAHVFSHLCDKLIRRWPRRARAGEKLMLLGYRLFRRLPNAASMIGWAVKPPEAEP